MGSQLATLVERTEVRVAAAEVCHTSLEPQTSRQGSRQVCHSHVEPCLGQAAADEARRERDAAEMALQAAPKASELRAQAEHATCAWTCTWTCTCTCTCTCTRGARQGRARYLIITPCRAGGARQGCARRQPPGAGRAAHVRTEAAGAPSPPPPRPRPCPRAHSMVVGEAMKLWSSRLREEQAGGRRGISVLSCRPLLARPLTRKPSHTESPSVS